MQAKAKREWCGILLKMIVQKKENRKVCNMNLTILKSKGGHSRDNI